MEHFRKRKTAPLLLAGVLVAWAGMAAQAEVVLSADQLRVAASEALRGRDPARARAYAEALLHRDPADLTAHLLRARAARDLGDYRTSQQAARRAWSLADTDEERYSSALIMAQALSSDGKRTRAQLWLRRAGQHAPDDRLEARAKRDFRYVQARNPWRTDLSFTLAPNSNINNGSARDSSTLNYRLTELLFGQPIEYPLSGSLKALSGLEYGFSAKTRYRFSQTETKAHDLNFAVSYRSFVLSESAKAEAPDKSGSDFAYGTASLGYGFLMRDFGGRGELSLGVDAGQSWYGGERYASFRRASVSQSYALSRTARLQFGGEMEWQTGQATADVDTLRLSGSAQRALPSGHQLYLMLATEAAQSPTADNEYMQVELRAGLTLPRPVFGADIQMSLGAQVRDYDTSIHSPDGRHDDKIFADVSATFRDIDYYGFNPVVTFSTSRTGSNIGLYDVNRTGISFGVRSAF